MLHYKHNLTQVLDYKVADLRNKLNKLKYQSQQKNHNIERLMKEYEKIVLANAEMVRLLRLRDWPY